MYHIHLSHTASLAGLPHLNRNRVNLLVNFEIRTSNLKTENGADIDGYIKKTNSSKSKLTGDFLFKKKDKKDTPETEERPDVVNKEAIA